MNARARRLAPFAGYVMVALIVVILTTTGDTPDAKASGAKVVTFFQHHKTSTHVADFLLAYAALAAVVYFTAVANYLRSRGSQVLATTAIGGAILAAAALCVGAGVNEALVDQPGRLTPDVAQSLNLLGNDLFGIMLFVGFALATTSMGVAMLRTKSVPTALGVVTTIVGVGFATGIVSWFAFLASGPLTLVIAAYVYSRSARPAEITLPDIPAQASAAAEAPAKATTAS